MPSWLQRERKVEANDQWNGSRRGISFSEGVIEGDLPASFKSIGFEYNGSSDSWNHVCRFEGMALLHRFTDGICNHFDKVCPTVVQPAWQWSYYFF